MLRQSFDTIDAEDVEQSSIDVDLSVAILVVRVGERLVVVTARVCDDIHRLLRCEGWLGL